MDPSEVQKWLVAAVKAETSLAPLEGRVFPDLAPEGTKNPCLVYQLVGDDAEALLDAGPLKEGTLMFQIRIYGSSRKSADALREAFRLRFQGLEPVAIGGGWRIEGSAWGEMENTYEGATKDFGSLGVVEFSLARK
jgi:hypothetical protein